MPHWPRFCAALLLAAPALAQPSLDFQGYAGRLDAVQLGEGWGRLTPATMPSLPLAGAMVTVLDCGEDCPPPVKTDAAGWFTIPGLGMESALLRFEPPACAEADLECEPLEPRQEVLENGARTVLGAKWPAGIEDTILRYMPSVAAAIYIKREGEIPGLPGATGAAARWAVWLNGRHGWHPYLTTRTFLHELMHLYEFQLRLACWHRTMDIDGWVLQEDWLNAYEADRRFMEENSLELREPEAYNYDDTTRRASETLAWFAGDYFTPESLALQWPWYGTSTQIKTYRELEQYAPNRYAWFERLVFGRYLDRKSWERANPNAEDWPGMCTAPLEEGVTALEYLLKSAPGSKGWPDDPPPTKCSFGASH